MFAERSLCQPGKSESLCSGTPTEVDLFGDFPVFVFINLAFVLQALAVLVPVSLVPASLLLHYRGWLYDSLLGYVIGRRSCAEGGE
jgi:hypothetical protein